MKGLFIQTKQITKRGRRFKIISFHLNFRLKKCINNLFRKKITSFYTFLLKKKVVSLRVDSILGIPPRNISIELS